MRPSLLRPSLALLVSWAALACGAAACAASPVNNFTTGTAGTGGNGAGGMGSSAGPGGGANMGGSAGTSFVTVGTGTSSTSSGGTGMFVAYAHTNKTLYKIDPMQPNLGASKIGDFDCIGGNNQDSSMTDVAVNQAGDIWGISAKNAYHLVIQGGAVHCAATVSLKNVAATFYGLSFAPANVIDATETLIAGNTAGELWKIDTTAANLGTLTQHGTFGVVPPNDKHGFTYQYAGKAWELSGDIAFLANNGMPVGFATVRDCKAPPSSSTCDGTDTLIEIDMTKLKAQGAQDVTLGVRGAIVKKSGCADPGNVKGYGGMYGIAAWNDKVYGFAHAGAIVEIDNTDGSACLVPGSLTEFWDGAAVTTSAPVIVPPPPS